mgnify:CR=1 FL=1
MRKTFFKEIILLLLITTSSVLPLETHQTLHLTSNASSTSPTFGIRVTSSDNSSENYSPTNSSCQEPLDESYELQLLLLTPQHILKEYSISLEKYLCSKDPQKLFEQYHFYSNQNYLNHIHNHTGYEKFILELHEKIHSNHHFRKSLRHMVGFDGKNGFADFVGREVGKIKQEQILRKQERQKQEQERQKHPLQKTPDPESLLDC